MRAPSVRLEERRGARTVAELAPYAALAVAVAVTFECLRVLFPAAYTYRERSGLTGTVVVVAAVFLAPVLALPLVRLLGRRAALVMGAVLLGAARLWLQHGGRITIGEAAVASALGLVTISIALVATADRSPRDGVVLALVAGLALDTVIRGAWSTWDPVWQSGAGPWAVAAALAAVLVAAAAWPGAMPVAAARSRIGPVAIAAGPFLALQVLFLQSPAFVASSGRVSLATAVAVVLVGDVLAIGAVRFAGTRAARSWPVVAAGGAALATVGGLLPAVTGGGVVVLVWCAQVLAAMLAARAFGPAVAREPSRPAGAGAALGAGSLAFGLTVLLYQLHYDRPLPVSNRWLPAAAAVILAAAAVSAARRADPAPAAPAGRPRARLGAAALAGAVALGAVVVAGGLDRGELSLAPAVRAPVALRVVTYNPHEAVTRDGRLDPAALAATVQRLRPDVLVVEEAGRGWPLSSSIDLAEWLKRRLGMRYVWAPAADHQFGNALFSRVPILDARVVALPRGDGTMGRSAVIAHVGPVHGVVLTVVGTHLQNGSTRARKSTRVAELHVLLRALGPVRRTVLAGDLNSDPGSRELRTLLAAGFTTTQPTGRCTLHTSNAHCVDWILVTPDLDQGPVRTLPVDTFDHRPLSATVRPR